MFLIQEFQCTNNFLIRFTWFTVAEAILILFSYLFVCSLFNDFVSNTFNFERLDDREKRIEKNVEGGVCRVI
jgi:hypothetical protein